ncbi:MAG: biotin/lipoyl-containing protein [Gammaproteobacteria bacterium]|nr:biotin/lipoyl-containing protein [Gammaproteobacteria bacterium]
MDLRKIRKLMELMEDSDLTEIEVRNGDDSVRIVRPPPAGSARGAAAPAASAADPAPAAGASSGHPVRAPMAGTFYAAPEPGAEAFVSEGQSVSAGDVVCIIESMKMLNEIKADRSGVCAAVGVANGQPVSAGDILFRIA